MTLEVLKPCLERARREGKKIVFTNGCFDIIHAGHVRYLKEARALGDILVIGLNSDKSVQMIKGKQRPICPEEERVEILLSLESVDYVILFDDPTPIRIIKELKPDFLVKGEDWAEEEIVGRDFVEGSGGSVVRLPLKQGVSTTKIIERIRKLYEGHKEDPRPC